MKLLMLRALLLPALLVLPTALGQQVDWVTGVRNKPVYDIRQYNFPALAPSGTLVAATPKTVTFSGGMRVPLGLNGSDVGHYLYITCSGGNFSTPITGGTAIAGGTSGTITFTPTNSCSAGWTILPASGGIQESAIASAGNGVVLIPPGSVIDIHAPVTVPASLGAVTFQGSSQDYYAVQRASDFLSGNLFSFVDLTTYVLFQDLGINNNPSLGTVTGSAIFVENTQSATVPNGWLATNRVKIYAGQYGIRARGTTVNLQNTVVHMTDVSYKPVCGVSLEGPYDPGVNRPASNHVINDLKVFSGSVANANVNTCGLGLFGVDGLTGSNLLLQGDSSLWLYTSSGNYNTLVYLDHLFIDHGRSAGIKLTSDGTGSMQSISISDSHIGGVIAGPGVDLGASATANITDLSFTNNDVQQNYSYGIVAKPNQNWSIIGNRILANNTNNSDFIAGIYLETCTSGGHVLSGNLVSNDAGIATGHTKYGLQTGGACEFDLTGGSLKNVETTPLVLGGVMTGVLSGVSGVTDSTTAITAASTLDLPTTSDFTLSGTTPVTTVTTNYPAGMPGTFTGSALFTSSASIGTTCLTQSTARYTWFWDGTKFWPNGPGCMSMLAFTPAGTAQSAGRAVFGKCTLGTDCAVTFTIPWTSSSSYYCSGTDQTSAAAVQVVNTSNSVATFTGTGTDVISFVCVGN